MISDADLYAEVFEILSCMDKQTVMKIPMEMLELLKEERNKDYVSRIDKEDLFNVNNIDQRTVDLITWFNINYWADEEEKARLIENCKENDRKTELEKIKKYGTTIPQRPQEKEEDDDDYNHRSKALTPHDKESLWDKIRYFFKTIFSN